MGNRFIERWTTKEKDASVASKIKSIGRPEGDLKGQISLVTQRLNLQIRSLDAAVQRFEVREKDIFQRTVAALSNRDQARANILATELGELRKVKRMLMQASLAMESVVMRLNTVTEMGDLVTILAPAASVLNKVRSGMSGIMPEACQELGNIGGLLGEIVTSTNQSTEISMNTRTVNAEAEQILEEAMAAAEKRLDETLPEVGIGVVARKRTSLQA
ncbi:MAG: hypothetical protein NWE98_12380 [Candidatus Bathyarchaeota archaeon]|nr:hypothetical protein [Candidatus Bathyarchaeota archaeon]